MRLIQVQFRALKRQMEEEISEPDEVGKTPGYVVGDSGEGIIYGVMKSEIQEHLQERAYKEAKIEENTVGDRKCKGDIGNYINLYEGGNGHGQASVDNEKRFPSVEKKESDSSDFEDGGAKSKVPNENHCCERGREVRR